MSKSARNAFVLALGNATVGCPLADEMRMKSPFFLSAIFCLAMAAAPSTAAVTVTFMSRDSSANSYPHAFVRVTGATDANPGVPIDTNYGFTAIVAGPGVLLGPVAGEILTVNDGYVKASDAHFSLILNDQQYGQLLALIDTWRRLPGPSYDLHKRNCVHFVKAVAELEGLTAEGVAPYMLKPRSFLDELTIENRTAVILNEDYSPKHQPK